MCSHVYDELAGLDERFPAHVALVGPLARMDAHVPVQLAAVLERSATDLTLVRALLRVDPPVHLQILLHAEHLMAELALERPLAGVRAVVPHQPCRHRERLLAHVALVRVGLWAGRRAGTTTTTTTAPTRSNGAFSQLGSGGKLFARLLLFGMRFHMAGVGALATEANVALIAAKFGTDWRSTGASTAALHRVVRGLFR